ncbi:MAG: hypothetical protein H0U73_11615 [Tatlockia sp.]|nr:hypothetical protein [Tatlockia sp.]
MSIRFLFLLFFTNVAIASPWFTGPLLAPAGRTIPPGHFNFEPYGFYTEYAKPPSFRNIETTPILSAGITNFLDVQALMPFDYSWIKSQQTHGGGIGDFNIGLGLQALRQKAGTWYPDLRILLQEVIPTGRFENLNPLKQGTDQTGSGSYQTVVSFNFQKLYTFENEHYIRSRLSLSNTIARPVFVEGLNTYGGNPFTEGTVRPGKSYAVDLASEYTLTQHWVLVMEGLYVHNNSTTFQGNPGVLADGTIGSVGGPHSDVASLAPAVEYNFSSNLGIIGGVWFTVTGPRAEKFIATTIAVNYYFPK